MRGAGVGDGVRVQRAGVERAEHRHRALGERDVEQCVVLQVRGALVGGPVRPQTTAHRTHPLPGVLVDEPVQRRDEPRRVGPQPARVLEDDRAGVAAEGLADRAELLAGQCDHHGVAGLEALPHVVDDARGHLRVVVVEERRVLQRGDVGAAAMPSGVLRRSHPPPSPDGVVPRPGSILAAPRPTATASSAQRVESCGGRSPRLGASGHPRVRRRPRRAPRSGPAGRDPAA